MVVVEEEVVDENTPTSYDTLEEPSTCTRSPMKSIVGKDVAEKKLHQELTIRAICDTACCCCCSCSGCCCC